MTPSHGGGIRQVPCLGPRSGPMFGATQWSHAWGHAVVPCLGPFATKISRSIVWRGVWYCAPGVFALTHQRPQSILCQLSRKIRQNLSNISYWYLLFDINPLRRFEASPSALESQKTPGANPPNNGFM